MSKFNHETILKELKEFGELGWAYIPYADFIFSDYTQEIFDEINNTVFKDMGIDSRMIIGSLLCGIEDNISSLFALEKSTLTNLITNLFTNDQVFKEEYFKIFLKNCDKKLLKKLFLTIIVEFRDTGFLDLSEMVTYSDIINPTLSLSIQQTTVKDNIILQGLVIINNDDNTALEDVLVDLDETKEILTELQDNIGKTGNSKIINNAFKNTRMLLHSKYCSNENLETAYLHDFNILTRPKELTRQIPEKYKENPLYYKDEIIEKYNKLTKRHLYRIKDGYACIWNEKSKLIKSYANKSKYNQLKIDSPRSFQEFTNEYEMSCDPNCPFEKICSTKTFKQKNTPLKNKMFNKFMNQKNVKTYSKIKNANYQISVQIKKIKQILYNFNYDETMVQNYLFLINISLNLKRKIKLKGVMY